MSADGQHDDAGRSAPPIQKLRCSTRAWIVMFLAFMTVAIVVPINSACAAGIVFLGASNTNGKGVGSDQAYPMQLQSMLRAKGIEAQVSVQAVNGSTSAQLLGWVDAIPAETRLVLIEPVRSNDQRVGISPSSNAANLAEIGQRLRARGIKSMVVLLRPLPSDGLQPDGIHLTAHGHQVIAARYLPRVIAALKSR